MEKLSRKDRTTYILAAVLGAVLLVVGVLVLTYPDPVVDGPAFDAGAIPAAAGGSAPSGQDRTGSAVASGPAVDPGNTLCRSYVYKRCNELQIVPTDCRGAAETAAGVPKNLGLAGCRSVIDDTLARMAGVTPEQVAAYDPDAARGDDAGAPGVVTDTDVVEPDAGSAVGAGEEPPEASAQAGAGVDRPARDPAEVAKAMERMRQLETEISFARNTYVGTNIGVQSRLDEMRAIAEDVGTPEARSAYDSMLATLGRGQDDSAVGPTQGASASPGSGPNPVQDGGRPVSPPVQAAPSSIGAAQPVTGSSSSAPVVEAAPASF